MNARMRWALRQAAEWLAVVGVVAGVAALFGHSFLGIRTIGHLGLAAFFALTIMAPLAWLIYPLEMRFRDWEARRRRVSEGRRRCRAGS